ncbi:MAG: hypothetical protein HY270_18255 [Deltaproteobacteria bacterium]|nr:hypothetical protein [Deltaproteobacteria bacterium]
MSRLSSQRGAALVAALSIAIILLPVGGWMLMQTRGDFLVSRNLRGEMEALYVADAGVAHAVAQIEADGSFTRLLAVRNSGVSPFASAPAAFPESPFRYDVVVAPAAAGTLRILSTGYGRNGANKRVEALLQHDASGHLQLRWREDL